MLIGSYNKTVLITYLGIVVSIAGMMLALQGKLQISLVCLIIAGLCDLFDGRFANLFERNDYEKGFGIEIDSLGDMINFAAFPVILFYSLGLNDWWHLLLFSFYVLAAITRLAHFNVIAKQQPAGQRNEYFQGLPVTYSALIFPLFWLLISWFLPAAKEILFVLLIISVGILFILNIKIPKPKGRMYVFFGLLAIVVSFLILNFDGPLI